MGDVNQILFAKEFLKDIDGPVLEIGSKNYGSTSSLRDYYTTNEYIGVDLEDGDGVDMVLDLESGIGELHEEHFQLGVCCSVLEHVARPWIMSENITRLIAKGGYLFMSVPWVWRFHAYPDDFYRFSYRGIEALFPEFEWSNLYYSTNVPGEFVQITEGSNGPDNQMAVMTQTPKGKRKHLPYLMVNMIGKRAEG